MNPDAYDESRMEKKKITIDTLAGMINRGFEGIGRSFEAVDKRFDAVDTRLDRIERLVLVDHKRRIERLEMEMKELKDMLAVK
jgi:hypothetical protein